MSYGGQQNRTEWYDRAARSLVSAYLSGGIAPHGEVTRWTYTVPAAKKAIAQLICDKCSRDSAPGVASYVVGRVYLTPSGGAAAAILQASFFSAAAGVGDTSIAGGTLAIYAGDVILGTTADFSTGGTCTYVLTAQFAEFDA